MQRSDVELAPASNFRERRVGDTRTAILGGLPFPERSSWREIEVLRACITAGSMAIAAGSMAAAAFELGISETTARQHLSGLYRRTSCMNAAPAAYKVGFSDGRRPRQ